MITTFGHSLLWFGLAQRHMSSVHLTVLWNAVVLGPSGNNKNCGLHCADVDLWHWTLGLAHPLPRSAPTFPPATVLTHSLLTKQCHLCLNVIAYGTARLCNQSSSDYKTVYVETIRVSGDLSVPAFFLLLARIGAEEGLSNLFVGKPEMTSFLTEAQRATLAAALAAKQQASGAGSAWPLPYIGSDCGDRQYHQ